jgi:PIN domain
MPPFDELTLKAHITAGRIGALSVDTSIFDKLGRNLNFQPLLGLAQFRHGPTKFVLSEVVVGELKTHLHDRAHQAKQELAAKVRNIATHWHRSADASAVETALGVDQDAGEFSEEFLAAYVEAVAPLIIGVETVEPTELLRRYLGAEPPFGDKEAKKHEFPDALALSSLDAWAKNERTFMLVISGDNGWKEFCDKSDNLICMNDLPPALNLFNENAGVVVSRVLAKLAAGQAQDLHKAIDATLESFLEEIDIDLDFDSSAEYEAEDVEPSVNCWRIYDPAQADVISADDELLVFSVPVHADVSVGIYFRFSHWDSVDREYVRLGSRTLHVPKEIEVMMTISINREIEPEPDVLEISTTPYSITLDLGNVDSSE